jgi:hypothetical protein
MFQKDPNRKNHIIVVKNHNSARGPAPGKTIEFIYSRKEIVDGLFISAENTVLSIIAKKEKNK